MPYDLPNVTVRANRILPSKPTPTVSEVNANFSLSAFRSKFVPVRPNLFSVQLSTLGVFSIAETFEFRVESAEFPGKNIATSEIAGGGGPTVRVASDVTYGDLTLTIICSDDYNERIFFEEWMNLIYQEYGRTADEANEMGLFNYYENYAKGNTITVRQHDASGKTIYQSIFKEVYPTAISAMTANWDERDTYQRFTVTLAYNRVINQQVSGSEFIGPR